METFEMPFKLGNDAKAALVGEYVLADYEDKTELHLIANLR